MGLCQRGEGDMWRPGKVVRPGWVGCAQQRMGRLRRRGARGSSGGELGDGVLADGVDGGDELGELVGQGLLGLGGEAIYGAGQVEAGPAFVPGLGFDTGAQGVFEEGELIGDEVQEALVALGVARLEVQAELDATAGVVDPAARSGSPAPRGRRVSPGGPGGATRATGTRRAGARAPGRGRRS